MMELDGKTVLITGAGSVGGIGADAAHLLAREGASVIVSGRDEGRGQRVVDSIHDAGGTARFLLADLTNLEDVTKLADDSGDVDVLVNNAGFYPVGSSLQLTAQNFYDVYHTNVTAPYFLVQKLAPAMLARGWGSIINITSIAAKRAMAGMSLYGSSKAALETLTKYWAAEFAAHNVRVNAISPGTIGSDNVLASAREQGIEEQIIEATPMKRIAALREISEVVLFLASDRSSFITGTVVSVDGGRELV